MKNVFSNHELPHVWAHQRQASGRNSNGSMFFEAATIFSYGAHFPIATIHQYNGENVYFVTTRSYSVTTQRHISTVRSSIPRSASQFLVHDPTRTPAEQVSYFKGEIDAAIEYLCEAKNKVSRAKRFGELQYKVNYANTFVAFFALGTPFSIPENFDAIKAEHDKVKAELQAREDARRARVAEERKAHEAQRLLELSEVLEAWRNGAQFDYRLGHFSKTFLRVKGENVETSKGAEFPVSHALLGLQLVNKVIKSGVEYRHENHTLHLGHYCIERIETNGNVTAGCHYVEYDEIARIASALTPVLA